MPDSATATEDRAAEGASRVGSRDAAPGPRRPCRMRWRIACDDVSARCSLVRARWSSRQPCGGRSKAASRCGRRQSTGLQDSTDHVEWLPAAKGERSWDFWDRYRRFLEEVKLMPRQVVWRLDDEHRPGARASWRTRAGQGRWHREGLVVGQVQSGKTANYIGLICKAADAGLQAHRGPGRHRQRPPEPDPAPGRRRLPRVRHPVPAALRRARGTSYLGVGAMPGATRLKVASLTNSAENGDFKRAVAEQHQHPDRGLPCRARHQEAPQHPELPAQVGRGGRRPADRPRRQEDRP